MASPARPADMSIIQGRTLPESRARIGLAHRSGLGRSVLVVAENGSHVLESSSGDLTPPDRVAGRGRRLSIGTRFGLRQGSRDAVQPYRLMSPPRNRPLRLHPRRPYPHPRLPDQRDRSIPARPLEGDSILVRWTDTLQQPGRDPLVLPQLGAASGSTHEVARARPRTGWGRSIWVIRSV